VLALVLGSETILLVLEDVIQRPEESSRARGTESQGHAYRFLRDGTLEILLPACWIPGYALSSFKTWCPYALVISAGLEKTQMASASQENRTMFAHASLFTCLSIPAQFTLASFALRMLMVIHCVITKIKDAFEL